LRITLAKLDQIQTMKAYCVDHIVSARPPHLACESSF
jgi:hypothetical protein